MDKLGEIIKKSINEVLLKEYEFDNERHEREWNFLRDYKINVGDEYFSKKLFSYINFKGLLSEFIRFVQLKP